MGRHGLHLVHSKAWEKHHELPIYGVRSPRQMNRLTSKLSQCQQSTDRLQTLVYEMKICPQAFSGEQVITLASYFSGTELVLALHLFDNHLFGFRCDQAMVLLQMISVPQQRLDALQVIDENLLDPVNRFQLRSLFPSYLFPQVDQILAEVRGQSHIYGSVTSSRVIFLIDTSGSMSTEFQTGCGQYFNRLEFIVHDLHKILHHRVLAQFRFNIIHFGTHVHSWKHGLTSATSSHLKQAEHYLDDLEAHGQTNTYNALKQALGDEEADTIYLLSDGEPSMDTRTILLDLKVWLRQRRNPCVIHTVAFIMGHTDDDPKPREFMGQIAAISGGVFRCLDPFTSVHQEFGIDSYSDTPNLNDDDFVRFFQGRLRDVPSQLLQSVGFDYRRPYYSPGMLTTNQCHQELTSPDFKSQLKFRPRLQNDIDIPSFHHERGHNRFEICLNIQQIIPGQNGQWSVSHTFDEFKQLHHQLQKRCTVPTFPSSHHSLFHIGNQIHEQHRQDLETYIKQLYVYVSPYDHPEFDLFLLMELHANQIVQQAVIEWRTRRQHSVISPDEESPPPPYDSQ
ncbi:unnamed protein product [Adineta ricciae]|uniref:VWFA domain-containing protein n=1 Tax=Adineta ricciae TaxID=249248 RepID=A0A815FS36_ADIRI|nr:unnamed protein product [Adineta ricciae]CAF1417501.1 unnamed protein product [Adineta ricciae]